FPNEFEIEPCSLTLVCGNSGSGKSLFINYLAKLDSIKDDVYVSQTNSYPPLNYKVSEIISFLSVRQNSLDEFLNYIKPY
ncbi:MAG TPA: hypothetical protein DCY93_00235, partial [Firmicutes bacterium]|nr:hypothetical protein [Bacillota bacterium]